MAAAELEPGREKQGSETWKVGAGSGRAHARAALGRVGEAGWGGSGKRVRAVGWRGGMEVRGVGTRAGCLGAVHQPNLLEASGTPQGNTPNLSSFFWWSLCASSMCRTHPAPGYKFCSLRKKFPFQRKGNNPPPNSPKSPGVNHDQPGNWGSDAHIACSNIGVLNGGCPFSFSRACSGCVPVGWPFSP